MERFSALLAVAGAALGVGIFTAEAGLSNRAAAWVAIGVLVVGVVIVMATPFWGRSIDRSRERAGL